MTSKTLAHEIAMVNQTCKKFCRHGQAIARYLGASRQTGHKPEDALTDSLFNMKWTLTQLRNTGEQAAPAQLIMSDRGCLLVHGSLFASSLDAESRSLLLDDHHFQAADLYKNLRSIHKARGSPLIAGLCVSLNCKRYCLFTGTTTLIGKSNERYTLATTSTRNLSHSIGVNSMSYSSPKSADASCRVQLLFTTHITYHSRRKALKMCTVKKTMCRKCRKRWFRLVSPCGEGKNLETCPSFKDKRWRSEQQYSTTMVNADNCPSCTPAKYDGNQTRFIQSESKGVKFGLRPPRPTAEDPNIKIICCTMM